MAPTTVSHQDKANAIRALAMDAVEAAQSGHPGMPMGMADVATVLFERFLKFDAQAPDWPDRDRFVLSAGHGSMLLYALLHLTGYPEMTLDEIKRFRQMKSKTPGHPENFVTKGAETTTGPLGQGIATSIGMAIAERHLNARFGDALVDHYTYVIASDGDLMEGISHEAASLAGHLGLGRLIVLWDDNEISIDGPTSLSFSDDTLARFEAYGWDTSRVDGHDPESIAAAIAAARETDRPSLIACRTTIGYGAPNKAGTASSHGSPLGKTEIEGARERLGWPHAPFDIPAPILEAWRAAGRRGADARKAWNDRLAKADASLRAAFDEAIKGDLPQAARAALDAAKRKASEDKPKIATRQASGNVLDVLVPALPTLVGGSADLTGSNNTYVKNTPRLARGSYGGRYIHWGVREHGMAAAMNGMALHGGVIPYGGTFLVFADYCRPAIRLSALMRQRVVYVMTHDSIGLGEDGPTHQPVEHLASLRAIPNLLVMRPADMVEAAECWRAALERKDGPSLLALTRQALPTVRTTHTDENLSARGAYVLAEAEGGARRVTILATGSEVEIALDARARLQAKGVPAAVVSVPCMELFAAQSADYQAKVLGPDDAQANLRMAIEAGVRQGWDRWIGANGLFVGMSSFGESAPYQELYEHFGITAASAVDAALARL
ncbi:MAG TPA: transketolase [Azospirillaceae bacterium]|nr:transketolase [Azospirillaceae bacterium]